MWIKEITQFDLLARFFQFSELIVTDSEILCCSTSVIQSSRMGQHRSTKIG